jgi:hypothetical protein
MKTKTRVKAGMREQTIQEAYPDLTPAAQAF